jgi:hypothetical protein
MFRPLKWPASGWKRIKIFNLFHLLLEKQTLSDVFPGNEQCHNEKIAPLGIKDNKFVKNI